MKKFVLLVETVLGLAVVARGQTEDVEWCSLVAILWIVVFPDKYLSEIYDRNFIQKMT
jgi:hypothetical protein